MGLHTYAADTYATESLLLAPSKGLRLALLLCVQPAFDDRDREAREHRTRHEIVLVEACRAGGEPVGGCVNQKWPRSSPLIWPHGW